MLSTTLIYYLALTRLATARRNMTEYSKTYCDDEEFVNVYTDFNISSTNTLPAFQPPNTSPANWTVHFGVSDKRNASEQTSNTNVYMWLDSTDKETELISTELPWTGCLVTLRFAKGRKSTGNIGSDGVDGCKGVFSEKCYNALTRQVKASAQQPLDERDPADVCLDMVDFDDDDCHDDDDQVGWSKHVEGKSTHLRPATAQRLITTPNHSHLRQRHPQHKRLRQLRRCRRHKGRPAARPHRHHLR
jgi:hypothetical protein